jgi:phosphatidylglycerophosphate synthase
MNLHRTSGKPDWDKVAPASRNHFQKLAAATNGVVSPANIISIIGLGIVIYGLLAVINQQFWLGLVLLAIGRLLDIVDGLVAEATQTKSPLGELVDAAADKIGTLLTVVTLFIADVTYWWVIVALLLPQVIIPIVIFYKKQKGIGVHPTRAGKLSMAAVWAGIVGLLLVKAFNDLTILATVIYVVVGLSFVLGMYALWQYSTGRD